MWGRGVQETGEEHTGFWWGDLSRRGHLEDFGIHSGQHYNGSSGSGIGGQGMD